MIIEAQIRIRILQKYGLTTEDWQHTAIFMIIKNNNNCIQCI